jgi:hypothetical protein
VRIKISDSHPKINKLHIIKTPIKNVKKFPPLKYNASIFHDLNIVRCRLNLKSRALPKLRPIGCES